MLDSTKTTFVISDLHMGDRGARDNFQRGDREQQLLGFLDFVEVERAQLVILGDLFELWQANLSSVFVARRAMLDRFAQLGAVYVIGNHDVDLKHFVGTNYLAHPFFGGMRGPIYAEIGGKKFKFMHGHEPDPFNKSDAPSSGRMLAILAGLVEDWNGSPMFPNRESVEEVLERAGETLLNASSLALTALKGRLEKKETPDLRKGLTPTQHNSRLVDHIESIRCERDAERYHIAVVGHTHAPGRFEDWYFNSGSWTSATNDFLRIEPDGSVTYYQWSNGNPLGKSMPVSYS